MAGKGCRPDRALLIVFRKAEPSHAVSAHFDDHAAHLAVEFVFIGRADHRLVAGAHGFQDLAEPLVFLLCPPALGDVVQVCGDDGLPAHAGGKTSASAARGCPSPRKLSISKLFLGTGLPALASQTAPATACRSVSGSWHASMPRPRNSDAGRANNASAARLKTITLPCRSTPIYASIVPRTISRNQASPLWCFAASKFRRRLRYFPCGSVTKKVPAFHDVIQPRVSRSSSAPVCRIKKAAIWRLIQRPAEYFRRGSLNCHRESVNTLRAMQCNLQFTLAFAASALLRPRNDGVRYDVKSG